MTTLKQHSNFAIERSALDLDALMKKPILLAVEDELLLRMDLVEQAQEAGFETLEAGSAAEAILILQNRDDVRVVFTDIRMPGDMDGVALSHYVRDRWPPTIIVICSANAEPSPVELPTNTVFVAKPCTGPKIERLLASIYTTLQ